MSDKINGGPAFPQSYRVPGHSTIVGESGMSLRDAIAMQALEGILAHEGPHDCYHMHKAIEAYQYADAMLKARNA